MTKGEEVARTTHQVRDDPMLRDQLNKDVAKAIDAWLAANPGNESASAQSILHDAREYIHRAVVRDVVGTFLGGTRAILAKDEFSRIRISTQVYETVLRNLALNAPGERH